MFGFLFGMGTGGEGLGLGLRRKSLLMGCLSIDLVIAGFLTGGCLAARGGLKAARNSAIVTGCLLAVIEGVGIGFQRMMVDGTRLDVSLRPFHTVYLGTTRG